MEMTTQTQAQTEGTERAQPAAPGKAARVRRKPAVDRLKAERVEEKLREAPGWQVASQGRAIDRVREFPTPEVAALFGAYAMGYAGVKKLPVTVNLAEKYVLVTLHARSPNGRFDGLTDALFEVAKQLG